VRCEVSCRKRQVECTQWMRAYTAPRQNNAKRSRHGLFAAQLGAFPFSTRANRPTSAQSRAHRAAAGGGVFLTACEHILCTGTQSWRPTCVAHGAPQFPKSWGAFFEKGGEMYYRKWSMYTPRGCIRKL